MCLCFCGCQGGLRCSLFLLWWSCAFYVTIHTVNSVLLLAWWENRDQSPTASYNQLMSFFHLWRCSHTCLDSHSILEFRDSGFRSTFYSRGKWDSGRSKNLFVMVAPVSYLLSPQICCSRDREVRASPVQSTAVHPRLRHGGFSDKNSKLYDRMCQLKIIGKLRLLI